MIVGIDYTAAMWQGAGIGRYTRELVHAAVQLGGPVQYVLFFPSHGLPAHTPYVAHIRHLCATSSHVRVVPLACSPRLLTILWQRLRLPLRVETFTGPLDILHAPDFVLPPTRARTIITIHDLTFLVAPHCFAPSLQRYLARAVPRTLRRAHLVLADSEQTRTDLIRLLHADPTRVHVLYPGVRRNFRPLPPTETEPVRQHLGLPSEFLLFVGTLEPRKNIPRLLEAFHGLLIGALPCPDHLRIPRHLVIVGRRGWLYDDIFATLDRLDLHPHVHMLDFVGDDQLPALYNLAQVFVYPSLYEGFGLPVAEAMACGTPVVTSNRSSLPEVTGAAAILVDPEDPNAIAHGILQALALQTDLRTAGPRIVRRFLWEQSGRALLAWYLTLYEEGR